MLEARKVDNNKIHKAVLFKSYALSRHLLQRTAFYHN